VYALSSARTVGGDVKFAVEQTKRQIPYWARALLTLTANGLGLGIWVVGEGHHGWRQVTTAGGWWRRLAELRVSGWVGVRGSGLLG
jgi:hypothetical protein